MTEESPESVLDRKLRAIIAKMVRGTATPVDMNEYNELSKRRAQLMEPDFYSRNEKLRRMRVAS